MYAGRRKKFFVVVLAVAMMVSLAEGYISETMAMGTKTVTVTGRNYTVSSSLGAVANASLKGNTLYGYTNVSNPSVIFRNITRHISFAAYCAFSSTSNATVHTTLIFTQTLYSASTPSYSKLINYSTVFLSQTGSHAVSWIPISVNLTGILQTGELINSQLNVVPGPPSINVNVTAITNVGGNVSSIFSDVNLSFNYAYGPALYSDHLENYTYITNSGNHSGRSAILVNGDAVISLPNDKAMLGWISTASFAIVLLALAPLIAMFIPARKDRLERFIAGNKEEIVKVKSRPSIRGADFRVNSLEELLRTSVSSGQPLLMYEGEGTTVLYVRTEEAGYYMSFRRKHAGGTRTRPHGRT